MQAYSNPARANDKYALPDVEVFYDDADISNGHARNSQNRDFNAERWLDYIAGECGPNGGKVVA